ncbi:MAG: helix-turn-helix domain-containing protein [Butyrivibrio sp.]
MENKRYIISEASQKTGLEPHVLRYWEEELGLVIERNELGHRYYSEEQINLLCRVKEMKQKGFQLKAIKSELLNNKELPSVNAESLVQVKPSYEDKMEQFKAILGGIVAQALRENNVILGQEISHTVGDKVIKEMDYLLREKEEAEEERYKKLDETIRNCQKSNKEAAAGRESRFRRKKKKTL